MAQAPVSVRRLLQTYDPAKLSWSDADTRYLVVREILVRGDTHARRWLEARLGTEQLRQLVRRYRGAGCNDPDRKKRRARLQLSERDVPVRAYLGLNRRA